MPSLPRPSLRWLLYAAAAVVITMALAVGALRLLLPMVPDYHDDIRAWASEATGYDIRFESVSASWPLSGPELSFYGVSLARPGEAQALIGAREFSAGLSLWRLLRDGRLTVGRVAVRGSSLHIEHTADGAWRVQGRSLEDLLPRPRGELPEIDLVLRDIAVSFEDPVRGPQPVSLALDRLAASIQHDALSGEAVIELPEEFGGRLDIEIEAPGPLPSPLAVPADLQARVDARSINLVRLMAYVLGEGGMLRSASGDVSLELSVHDRSLQRLRSTLNLRGVAVGSTGYERLGATLSWERSAAGWNAAVKDLRVRRSGRDSPRAAASIDYLAGDADSARRWNVSAPFLRLDDVFPLARAALAGTEIMAQLPRALRGDVRELEVEFADQSREPGRYALRGEFDRIGLTGANGEAVVTGISGALAADGDGGRLQLASRDVRVGLTQWFRDTLQADSVDGLLVWRAGPDGVRFLSDDIHISAAAIDIRSRLEVTVPLGDESATMDLKANASATQAREVLRYLPLRRFPPTVVAWLERAVVAGRVPAATIEFRGPLREFPYDHGEGVFRVALDLEEATLDYANGWPRVEGLQGQVVFDGVGMSATAEQARLSGLKLQNYQVRIPDLRTGVLAISGRQRIGLEQLLGFMRATPLASALGKSFERLSGSGAVDTALRLALPIPRPAEYQLQMLFDARGCRLGWRQLPLDLRDLRGRLRLQNTRLSGSGLRAVMLGAPVRMALRAETADDGAVTHVANLAGTTAVGRVTTAFKLPLRSYFDGQLSWDATVTLPPRRAVPVPLGVVVQSDLRGVSSSLPAPLAKPAADAWPMQLQVVIPEGNTLEISGRLTPPMAWAVRLAGTGSNWSVERGMLRAGPGEARLPGRRGMEVVGRIGDLRLTDWLGVGDGGSGTPLQDIYREADLQFDRLAVAGQVFRDTRARIQRGGEAWAVELAGPHVEGAVTVPFDMAARPLLLDMKRLWLREAEPAVAGEQPADPRQVPAIVVKAEDAAVGDWRLGRLEMNVEKTPEGLVARSIAARAASFTIDGNAAWRVEGGDVTRQTTRFEATLASSAVKDTLQQLGYGAVLTGEKARVRATLAWPGAPRSDFLADSTGRIAVEFSDGQVLEVEPGGSGRLLGLLSVTALPRRLALDFSDVFSKGLGFDEVKGDFRIGSGSAYTCNLGLSGPVADIGIVGRAGFSARDYDQFAVVRPQMSSVLTVGGAVLGGPVGGATMLLISQLFRKPLGTLGESYYRVTGTWDQPAVDRVQRTQLDTSAFKDCEKEVAAALQLQPANPGQPLAPGSAGGTR